MSRLKLVVSVYLLLTVVCAAGRPELSRKALLEKWYRATLRAYSGILSVPQIPERYLTGEEFFYANLQSDQRVLAFSWSDCGSPSDPVRLQSLSVGPDPIHVPGDLQIGFNVTSSVDVTAPGLRLEVEIQKKVVFVWVPIPCVDGQGSCTYQDFCSHLPSTCPPSFLQNNVPCNCPVPQGSYYLPDGSTVSIPSLPLPSWATNGDYKARLTGKDQAGNRLFCIALQLTLD